MKNSKGWQALKNHAVELKHSRLKNLFEQHAQRGTHFSVETQGIYLDFSKNHITDTTLELFAQYSNEIHLHEKIDALFCGKPVNTSEKRAALHCSLRDKHNTHQIDADIHQSMMHTKNKALQLAYALNSGELKSSNGKPFKHLICLGIGGSFLGSKLVFDALKAFHQTPIQIHFVASIDESVLQELVAQLNLEDCLFLISSKSFTTLETHLNANHVKSLLLNNGVHQHQLHKHFIASTQNVEAALGFGCKEEYILPIWDFIGGRFSLWSGIGFPLMLALGEQHFEKLLEGAFEMDQHFRHAAFEHNMPIILGLLAVWYHSFLDVTHHAIIPYNHRLRLLPAFLQQLEMESLGKSVDIHHQKVDYPTGAIIWGSEGSNSQHAYHQLLLQGTHESVCDFIVLAPNTASKHQKTLALQALAQSKALAFGEENALAYKTVKGNQASNMLILENLAPDTLGALTALYEHKTFVQAALLNINPFDQWGVQLGKTISSELHTALQNPDSAMLDSSTRHLLKKLF